jgi:hypothetical protein
MHSWPLVNVFKTKLVKRRKYTWVVTITRKEEMQKLGIDELPRPPAPAVFSDVKYFDSFSNESTVFQGSSFKKQGIVERVRDFRDSFDVLVWDPVTGRYFDSNSGPFDRLDTLVNDKNIFYNVQASNSSLQYEHLIQREF